MLTIRLTWTMNPVLTELRLTNLNFSSSLRMVSVAGMVVPFPMVTVPDTAVSESDSSAAEKQQ